MDREQAILTTKEFIQGIYGDRLLQAIAEYCIERGKDRDLSYEFASLVVTGRIPFGINNFHDVVDYYNKKFNVYILKDSRGIPLMIY